MRIRMIRNSRGNGQSLAEGQELQVGADIPESDAKILLVHHRAVVCAEVPSEPSMPPVVGDDPLLKGEKRKKAN